jgi:hypothetical protein
MFTVCGQTKKLRSVLPNNESSRACFAVSPRASQLFVGKSFTDEEIKTLSIGERAG